MFKRECTKSRHCDIVKGMESWKTTRETAISVQGVQKEVNTRRKYIAALHCRSKCFFRSLETFQAVMRIFVHTYNKFGKFKQRFPRLKSAVGLTRFLPYL